MLLLATDIGLIGWITNNYKTAESFIVYLAVVSIFTILIMSVIINKKIIKDIKSLEDL